MRRWLSLVPLQHSSHPQHKLLHCSAVFLYVTPGKVKVHVKRHDGADCEVEAAVGLTLMEALRDVAKLGVPGTCNGKMECGTCHVYLTEASYAKTSAATEREEDLLAKSLDVRETSRLSCQVVLTEELDGLEVELPDYLDGF